jgi:ABC-2 type transport system ATP-binding protein
MITAKISQFGYSKHVVLRDIDLQLETGQTYGIVGHNGAGKTTFFNLMAGIIKDNASTFEYNGHPLNRNNVAFIDTDLFIYSKLTGKEFLSVFPATNPNYKENRIAKLFKLPLEELAESYSTGMKKKLLLLSQIKQNKDVFILDEPFNGLDLETNRILETILTILNKKGKTVILSSHILEPLLNVCHEIHFIKDQTISRSFKKPDFGSIEEVLFGNYTREIESELIEVI